MARRKKDDDGPLGMLDLARKRFELAQEVESHFRQDALSDLKFYTGEQWPADVKARRELENRPALTINRMKNFIHQVDNAGRQARASIQVNPFDDAADVETAKVIQGLVKHVEQRSDAPLPYDVARASAIKAGFGYFRFINKYANDDSFDQEVIIDPIWNPFSVYFDPRGKLPVGIGKRWAFITEELRREEYNERFPNSEVAGLPPGGIGDRALGWVNRDAIRLAEYYTLDHEKRRLYLLEDNDVVDGDELERRNRILFEEGRPELKPARERDVEAPVVHWRLINGIEVLDETVWPGREIPVFRVLGDVDMVDGKLIISGLIREAKDSQRMYNYLASAEAEAIALAPKAPFIAAEGQIKGYERLWKEANLRASPVLPYKVVDVNGRLVPPPQRQVAEPPIQAINQARLMSAEDLKATIGIYDASLGARSNETSGRAITARQSQGDNATYHFQDNLARALRAAARELVDVIPKVYDREGRVERILGDNGESRRVTLNQEFEENGEKRIYALDAGQYDVVVSMAPGFQTQRQEAVDTMLELTARYPQMVQVAGDLMVKNMDWPGAQEVADRLRRLLPPELQEEPEGGIKLPPQVKAQVEQLAQQVEQLAQALDQAMDTINQKRIESESRERVERMKIESDEQLKLVDAQLEGMRIKAQLILKQAELASKEDVGELNASISLLLKQIEAVTRREDTIEEQKFRKGSE